MRLQVSSIVLSAAMALGFGMAPAPVMAQERPLTMDEAVREAQLRHPDVLMAEARAEAARAGSLGAGAFRYPGLSAEAGWMRSNDPVAAFGTRLRQARFGAEDFDPLRLNAPSPISDWSTGLSLGWAPLDLASLAGFRAAAHQAEAADQGAVWARRAVGFRAQIRYMEAVGALEQQEAAGVALDAARENLRRIEARVREGLLTDADLLQAQAAEAAARAQQVRADQRVGDTRDALALALGWDGTWIPVPTETTFATELTDPAALDQRPDIRARALEVEAAASRVAQASRARFPRLEAFGRIGTHAPEISSGLEENWTLGVQIRIPVFTGFGLTAQRVAAQALFEAAHEASRLHSQEAAREIEQGWRALESTQAGAAAARAASEAAQEAVRLLQRRFEEGMATTAELLAAQAQAAAFRAQAIDAELALQQTVAHLAFLTQPLGEGMN